MTIKLTGMDGGTVNISPEALQSFKTAFRGPVLARDDAAYEEMRKIWNAMIDRRPGLIVRCTGTVDVVQAVRFARQHRRPRVRARRRSQHRGARGLRGRPDDRPVAAARRLGRSGAAHWRARRPAARWATSTARPSCTGSRRCSVSCRPPASPASPSAAASATSRAATAGPATPSSRWRW